MRLALVFLHLLVTSCSLHAAFPPDTTQVVAVITSAWDTPTGTMWRFEREGVTWRAVGGPVAVTVGHRGLGVGLGLHAPDLAGPEKSEGDRRAPAGIFLIESAFGSRDERKAGIGYRRATPEDLWVDDPDSSHYNQWVNTGDSGMRPDWKSAEILRREDGLYELALVVGHNRHPAVKGRGSAIFMHRWYGPGRSTIGCTAMDKADLRKVFEWLDGGRRPLLVQAPRKLLPQLGLPTTLLEKLESLVVR